jgi:hypothetical protein
MAKKKATKKKTAAKKAGKTKVLQAKKAATKIKIPSDHIQTHIIQKIVSAVDLDEKVRWSWGL